MLFWHSILTRIYKLTLLKDLHAFCTYHYCHLKNCILSTKNLFASSINHPAADFKSIPKTKLPYYCANFEISIESSRQKVLRFFFSQQLFSCHCKFSFRSPPQASAGDDLGLLEPLLEPTNRFDNNRARYRVHNAHAQTGLLTQTENTPKQYSLRLFSRTFSFRQKIP
jgi:hypothetical protein